MPTVKIQHVLRRGDGDSAGTYTTYNVDGVRQRSTTRPCYFDFVSSDPAVAT